MLSETGTVSRRCLSDHSVNSLGQSILNNSSDVTFNKQANNQACKLVIILSRKCCPNISQHIYMQVVILFQLVPLVVTKANHMPPCHPSPSFHINPLNSTFTTSVNLPCKEYKDSVMKDFKLKLLMASV